MASPVPRLLGRPVFPHVTVILGDPRLPDRTRPGAAWSPADLDEVAVLKATLAGLEDVAFTYLDDHAELLARLVREPPAYVLNLCDDGFKNDPDLELHVPALLDMLAVPYSGAGPQCLARCQDKAAVAGLARALGVPVPDELLVVDAGAAAGWRRFPALVKPNATDGSVGIDARAWVRDARELAAQVERLQREFAAREVLVQEFLPGTEYRVQMFGNPGLGYYFLPTFEWDYSALAEADPQILTWESKFDVPSPHTELLRSRHSALPDAVEAELRRRSIALFEALGCRDCAKIDFRADADGTLKMIDFNPNPSWDEGAYVNQEDRDRGFFYPDIVRLMLEVGQWRHAPPAVRERVRLG